MIIFDDFLDYMGVIWLNEQLNLISIIDMLLRKWTTILLSAVLIGVFAFVFIFVYLMSILGLGMFGFVGIIIALVYAFVV